MKVTGALPVSVLRQGDPKVAQGLAVLDEMYQVLPDFQCKIRGAWRHQAMRNLRALGLDAGQAAYVMWFWSRVKRPPCASMEQLGGLNRTRAA
ncbi:MAG: hypothetical protein BWY79_00952 [Actinobacteria bacterium ADurb.Bin444]|nr:MAG: hypothetical protein BWY79_00952 [Actinobacteria bacterium ADurb.Bin444]